MFLFLYLIIFGICSMSTCKSRNGTIDQSENISCGQIEDWLNKPLAHISSLHLKLIYKNHTDDLENPYIQWFLQQAQIPYTLSNYELENKNSIMPLKSPINNDDYVIITEMDDLRSTIRYFAQRSGTYFYVVKDNIDLQELQDICYILWTKLRILRQYFLTVKGIFIYDPFVLREQGEYGEIISYTGDYVMEHSLFHNMRGYPLRIQIFQSVYSRPVLNPVTKKIDYVEGLDGRVADILEKQMNFTMHLLDPDPDYFGERLPNGSYNGAIGGIIDNTVDICLTGFFVKDYFTRDISFSVAMYEDQLCIYTRKAQRVPDYLLPIFAVHYNVWIGFIVIAFFLSVVWALLRFLILFLKIHRHDTLSHHLRKPFKIQYIRILIDTWVAWVRVSLNEYPVFHSEKVLVVSLCLVSVIFGAIFECSLASSHIEPLYFKDINTLQELNNTGLPIFYRHASMKDDLFVGETSLLFASLNAKTIHKPDRKYNILEEIVDKGLTTGVNRFNSLMLESLDLIISKRIWIIPEFPKRYSISYVWHHGAPWEETLNEMLLKFSQAGIIVKFERDMKIETEINLIKREILERDVTFRILTVRDLQLAFYVVTIGNMMALITWILEKVLYSLNNR
ncbi:uncharacterized protein LOC142219894 [Haematobia irritans]|uniref:uncharacterized protein LOC142219894 n=1 Tax=Haematobia irritans TaxID=7368 RepID=UPI003F508A3F